VHISSSTALFVLIKLYNTLSLKAIILYTGTRGAVENTDVSGMPTNVHMETDVHNLRNMLHYSPGVL
jgi:hypothetical protein